MFHYLRSVMLRIFCQVFKPDGPIRHKIFIIKFFFYKYIYHPQSQGSVCTGTDGHPLSASHFCSGSFSGIYNYDFSTLFLCLKYPLHIYWGKVRCRVGAPNHNKFGVFYVGKTIHEHSSHSHMGSYHSKGYIT